MVGSVSRKSGAAVGGRRGGEKREKEEDREERKEEKDEVSGPAIRTRQKARAVYLKL